MEGCTALLLLLTCGCTVVHCNAPRPVSAVQLLLCTAYPMLLVCQMLLC